MLGRLSGIPACRLSATRRSCAAGLAVLFGAVWVVWPAPSDAADTPRFEVGLWVDHQDFATPAGGREWDTVSPKGLEEIIDYCRAAGATSIYWRDFGGGLVIHNSRLEEGLYPQVFDKRRTSDPLFHNGGVRYGNCQPDIVATVVEICHRKGLKCLVYWPWEDTHNLQAFISRFSLEHPGFWDERSDGYSSPARLSLAFRQVRAYKLALAKEMLALGVDGFLIDYRRQSNWNPDFGYVAPAVCAFRQQTQHASDPNAEDWLRFRVAYNTWMLEELRALGAAAGRPIEIIAAPPVVTPDPVEQLRTRFVDWPSWVALGLIDGLAPDGLPYDPQRPMDSIVENMGRIRSMVNGRCKLYWSIRSGYDWGNGLRTLASLTGQSSQDTLAQVLKCAWENGAAGVQDDTYDPGLEPQEWIDTLRMATTDQYKYVNPNPSPAAAAVPVEATYARPPDVEMPTPPKPSALEDTVIPVTMTQGENNDTEARFSPDGRWIVFQSDRGKTGVHIWLAPSEGGEPAQLTDGKCHDLFPTFSPDGQTIAFCSDRADGRFYHLYVIPVSGGELKPITTGQATDTLPCFTRDGSAIIFTSTRGTDLYTHSNVLYEVPIGGGEPRCLGLLKYAQMQPTLSRDDTRMAFTALDDLQDVNFYACVAPYGDPAARVRLTPPNESCYGAAIAPNGLLVAYTSPGPDRSCGWDVWVRSVADDGLLRITNNNANDRSPAWSPDGKRLVFESNRDRDYHLYTIDVSGSPLSAHQDSPAWAQESAIQYGMVDSDNDPEHTPLQWGDVARPALDYANRSFGCHLGQKTHVESITVVDDMREKACRIDAEHTELYYGNANGTFERYKGPSTFSLADRNGVPEIRLSGLNLDASVLKVRFAFPDKDYASVCGALSRALYVNDTDPQKTPSSPRLWMTFQGENRLLEWKPTLGGWEAQGHTLLATDTEQSTLYSGEGARIILPQTLAGDFDFACQFFLPDNSTGAGGPIVYFRVQDDGSCYAFRYISDWGTAVLHKKRPGQPWRQIGYVSGQGFSVGQWHDLALHVKGAGLCVEVDGKGLLDANDTELGDGMIGLGCQVRQVQFRHIRISATSAKSRTDWRHTVDPLDHIVICEDAGRGGYQAFPGLCLLRNGDLLAVYYAGWTHVSRPGGKMPDGGAIALSRSTDNGRSWSRPQTVIDTPLDDRDPAVWQCDDGTVYVSSISANWPEGRLPLDDWHPYTVRSADNGHTWSAPQEFEIGGTHEYVVWTEPRRLQNGEWLWPGYRNNVPDITVAFLRSTDGGHTWGGLTFLDETAKSLDEPDICQFPDGSLFCAMRPENEPHMWQSSSLDNGHTWSKPQPLPFFGHCANLLYLRSGVTLLGHRDPGMTIHYSLDRATTWACAVMIDPCGGAYSQMVELPDGNVLVVYYTEGARSQIRAQLLHVDKTGRMSVKCLDTVP